MRTPVPFRTAFPLLAVLFATAFGVQAQVPTSLALWSAGRRFASK